MKEKVNTALSLKELQIWGMNGSAALEDKGRTGLRRPGHGAEHKYYKVLQILNIYPI